MSVISYKAYQLNKTLKGEYQPSLERQLADIRKHFKRIYNVEPGELLIGPIKKGEQIIVPEAQVYIQLPGSVEVQIEGYAFTTGYDTEHPELKV